MLVVESTPDVPGPSLECFQANSDYVDLVLGGGDAVAEFGFKTLVDKNHTHSTLLRKSDRLTRPAVLPVVTLVVVDCGNGVREVLAQ